MGAGKGKREIGEYSGIGMPSTKKIGKRKPFAINGIWLGRSHTFGIPSGKWGKKVHYMPKMTAESQNGGPCVYKPTTSMEHRLQKGTVESVVTEIHSCQLTKCLAS